MSVKRICLLSSLLLLLAIPSFWPYGYYVFLRWVIFITSLVLVVKFYESDLQTWSLIFGAVSFLFNPIFPIHMVKSSWVVVDFIVAILFFSSYSAYKGRKGA